MWCLKCPEYKNTAYSHMKRKVFAVRVQSCENLRYKPKMCFHLFFFLVSSSSSLFKKEETFSC